MSKLREAREAWQSKRVMAAVKAGCPRRHALRMAGARQVDVARKVGVSSVTLMNWETGNTHPRIDQLAALARVYGVPLESLLDDV